MSLTRSEAKALRIVIERLKSLADPESDVGCTKETKMDAAIYLNSWCIPYLEAIATDSSKRTGTQKSIIKTDY